MSGRISKIYYFDYTNNIGFYDSIRNFTSIKMEYVSMAILTEEIRVNSTPTVFKINEEGTELIREYVIVHMYDLVEISKDLAINSPRYILICYADDTKKYFKYNKEFCDIFLMASSYRVADEPTAMKDDNPYVIQKNSNLEFVNKADDAKSINSKKKDKILWGKIIIFIFIVFGLFAIANLNLPNNYNINSSNNDKIELTPVAEPQSGEFLFSNERIGESEITVTASGGQACVVKLKTESGVTKLSFYVRAGDTVTVGVPCEMLYVYFASGSTWYGTKELFGKHTSYSMDDEISDFTQFTWEYKLTPQSSGNFSVTPIDASEF